MPKKEIKYYCNLCDKDYLDEKKAIECEQKHLSVKKIDAVNYDKNDRKSQYPDSIDMTLSSGEKIRYYREARHC